MRYFMKRFFLSAIAAVVLIGGPVVASAADQGTPAAPRAVAIASPVPNMSKSMSLDVSQPLVKPASTTCPTGKTYVKAYTKKNGKQVAGHCRKAKLKTM
jgi:hypothetical protein